MKHTVFLSPKDVLDLEYEIVSQEVRVYYTRLIEKCENFNQFEIINKNTVVNRSRSLAGLSVYVLEGEDYESSEYAWHNGEFELALRRNGTPQFLELLCELIEREWLTLPQVNEALEKEASGFRLAREQNDIVVNVLNIKELEEEPDQDEHPNIRLLVNRMESALSNKDYSLVLHSSASIFETLAKDILGISSIPKRTRERETALLLSEIFLVADR